MPRREQTIAARPGEILRTDFIEPLGITAYQLAKALHSPSIYEIVRGQRAISADIALRLGKYFGMTPQFWMNLQTDYDLRLARGVATEQDQGATRGSVSFVLSHSIQTKD